MKDQSTVLYLDFVKDVDDVTDIKKGKQIYWADENWHTSRDCEAILQGRFSMLVATKAYELGVDIPYITQVVQIGCPCNVGVLQLG